MTHDPHHLIAAFSLAVGSIMAAVTRAVANTAFLQSLIIAVVSGLLTGSALIFSAWITGKRTDERVSHITNSLDDVKGQIDAAKRRTDHIDARDAGNLDTERGGS